MREQPPPGGPVHHPYHSAVAYDQVHHHSAPNIHENFSPVHPPHPSHPPPPLPSSSAKCPRHGTQDKKVAVEATLRSPVRSRVKDTKEIMKKRRERAICVVSLSTLSTVNKKYFRTGYQELYFHQRLFFSTSCTGSPSVTSLSPSGNSIN